MPATIVAYDNLGFGDEWNASSQRSTTMPNQGNPAADHDIAQGFDVPAGTNVELTSFELVLYRAAGTGRVDISLVGDRDQSTLRGSLGTEPDLSDVLEAWTLTAVPTSSIGTLLKVESTARPILDAGKRYWIVLSVPDADSNVAWKSARSDFPGPGMIGERDSSLPTFDWSTFIFSDSGGFALRVSGTAA